MMCLMSFAAQASEFDFKVGERAYRGSIYPAGGIIVHLDVDAEKAYLRVAIDPRREVIVTEDFKDLSVRRGCLKEFCVGDEVFLSTDFKPGLKVLAINHLTQVVLLSGELNDGSPYLFEHEAVEIKKL